MNRRNDRSLARHAGRASLARAVSFVLLATFLHGCRLPSVAVRTIGARAKWGRAERSTTDNVVSVDVVDAEVVANVGHGGFASSAPSDNGIRLGTVVVAMDKPSPC